MAAPDTLRYAKVPLAHGSGAIPVLGFATLIPDPLATKWRPACLGLFPEVDARVIFPPADPLARGGEDLDSSALGKLAAGNAGLG
jgi:hypothetical protein